GRAVDRRHLNRASADEDVMRGDDRPDRPQDNARSHALGTEDPGRRVIVGNLRLDVNGGRNDLAEQMYGGVQRANRIRTATGEPMPPAAASSRRRRSSFSMSYIDLGSCADPATIFRQISGAPGAFWLDGAGDELTTFLGLAPAARFSIAR